MIKKFNNFNEGWFSKKQKDQELEKINDKISEASFSLKTFGTLSKQGAFINGAKWAVFNLTDDEIQYMREKMDKDSFSFIGESLRPNEGQNGSVSFIIDDDEINFFQTEGSLRNLITNEKISLVGNTVWYYKDDKQTEKILKSYFPNIEK